MLSLLLLLGPLAVPPPVDPDGPARAAIVAAVRHRFGADALVAIDDLRVLSRVEGTDLLAVPDPDSRLERPVRFTLRQSAAIGRTPGPQGRAQATVRVVVDHAHAARAIERGTVIGAADVTPARHLLAVGLLKPRVSVAEVARARVLRDVAPDTCLTASVVAIVPVVRSGDEVMGVARSAGVHVSAAMVAAQSGHAGSVIRVVNPRSRRAVKARVVSAGVVEILQ